MVRYADRYPSSYDVAYNDIYRLQVVGSTMPYPVTPQQPLNVFLPRSAALVTERNSMCRYTLVAPAKKARRIINGDPTPVRLPEHPLAQSTI